jgi:protein ImuB
MLWVALHLPLLSLESFVATLAAGADADPLALTDVHGIVCANAAAQALGIAPGLKRATALALAPLITLGQADAARDAQALAGVAHVALAFTPSVTVQPGGWAAAGRAASPDTVLLEVQASLRHFGGPERRFDGLLKRLRAALAPLGHRVQIASAPTPMGAALLARGQGAPGLRSPQARHCADLPSLHATLEAAPVWLLGPAREHGEALQGMGLRTLGDLLRLPRSGVARRFGAELLDELDRARGERPDPREAIVLPDTFETRLELFARADTTEQVLHGATLLLARMVVWLSAQHAHVRRFTLVMQHEPRWRRDTQTPTETPLTLALTEPSRDPAHLQVLLRERLAQLQLPAPSIELRLRVDDMARRAPLNEELFPNAGSEREGLLRLVERLQARLGADQVQRLVPVPDHRPERASLAVPVTGVLPGGRVACASGAMATHTTQPTPVRPIWLLAPPQALNERHHQPLLDGRELHLLSGPERIEAGWWDAALAERDYFIAQTGDGALVWVYRTRVPLPTGVCGWFLQGRFG